MSLSIGSLAQQCDLSITGSIRDLSTNDPIEFANIFIKESQVGTTSDEHGRFYLSNVCPGHYHVLISHVGCETQEVHLDIHSDTTLTIILDHDNQLLDEISVVGEGGKVTTQERQSLNAESIAQNADKNLANMLERMSGVSMISSGSGIAKPVVHGLYGNRLSILNNGIAQSGQQWGIDHSPEIDPLVADRITVIKGVGALEYQGNSLGSVVLVEPNSIAKVPHLHGEGRYYYETNGRAHGVNVELKKYTKSIAWRAVATYKKNGDRHTPDYYLRNTGNEEKNIALQLEKQIGERWQTDLYFSSFNATLGVLRGSHIGNLTDLRQALSRDEPFFTQDNFSYTIEAPRQRVNHHLLKLRAKYDMADDEHIELTYAGQFNRRHEYDVRRNGRSNIPALSLDQWTHFGQARYQNYMHSGWRLKAGLQIKLIDNTNVPGTGILPLIPDYLSFQYGTYAIVSRDWDRVSMEIGGRYDGDSREVLAISTDRPLRVIRYNHNYHNMSMMAGGHYEINNDLRLNLNVGYAARNPEVNELYSFGLHQGISGIEEGNRNLKRENSLKSTLSLEGRVGGKLLFETLLYYQNIKDYIYLKPEAEFRLTIRGAFPVYIYTQTDARIAGADLAMTYSPNDFWSVVGKYSYLKGDDRTNGIPLVYMPANNFYGELNYSIPEWGGFENIEMQINGKYVFEQKHILKSQDFAPAPKAYSVVGVEVSAERQMRKFRIKPYIKVSNLFDVTYRDYLNRQRYFANDMGFNMVLGVNTSF